MSELFLGFYLGAFSIILLFNLLSYVYYKEKGYLYYFLMHISVVLLALNIYNIIKFSTFLLVYAIILFSYLFTKEFLATKKYDPKMDKALNYFIIIFTSFLLLIYFTNNQIILKTIPYSLIFFFFVIVAIRAYKRGFLLAKYFIIAWATNSFIIFLSDLDRIFDITIIYSNYLAQIGNILEGSLLSIALFAKTRMLIKERNENEKMLIHQSRLASMGEMLANISHQWRQPLNRIASFVMNMQMHILDTYKDEKYLNEKLELTQEQLEYMSHTIDDFSNFYKKDKEKENFFISSAIQNAINIIRPSLNAKKINLSVEIKEDFELNSFPKELAQVILNLIQNAKDALILNSINKGYIKILVEKNIISVSDNAGGIKEEIINKIFDPYFTTKELHKGTGLGLYMSRIIIEKNVNAKIKVVNTADGAKFRIVF